MESSREIKIEDVGIATVLKRRLVVPPNQREYSWEADHVKELFDDLQRALDESQPPAYFLGTIALTGPTQSIPQVTDGQQRLATTMLLLAAIRDHFFAKGNTRLVEWLEQGYLTTMDPDEGRVPRLTLNIDDRNFFAAIVAAHVGDDERNAEPKRDSHRRIQTAASIAAQRVKTICAVYTKETDRTNRLRAWVDFLTDGAIIIALRLPSDLNAFKMFETLNDRGLRTSQVDIVKNYLFSESGDRMMDVQPKWSRMMTVIEGIDIEEVAVHYLRHFMMFRNGHLRKEQIFQKIEGTVSGKKQAIDFVQELSDLSEDYAAILSPDHKKWNTYHPSIRSSIRTLRVLQVGQIRPLMLAVAKKFQKKEAEISFRRFVSWAVRFLIAGGGGAGTLDEAYAKASHSIYTGAIRTFNELVMSFLDIIPKDAEFHDAFSIARVSKSYLIRYYLRALELKKAGEKEPEWIPNDDQVINLEHVLPENPGKNWAEVDDDTAQSLYSRIGNLVLLQASKNSLIGNSRFSDKCDILKKSTYSLTSEVGRMTQWGPAEISERQKRLAALAVETWPIK